MKPITRVEDFPFERNASYSTAEVAHLLDVSPRTVRALQFLGVPLQIRWTHLKIAVDGLATDQTDRGQP